MINAALSKTRRWPWRILFRTAAFGVAIGVYCPSFSAAAAGTTGAAFLDIPVGARPAALGSAYSALAIDGYAPAYNPGAMGFTSSDELTGMHLSYLDSINYEYVSYVHPFTTGDALGFSMQLLLPGSIDATDLNGNSIGSIGGHYAAYGISYAHLFSDRLSLGVTGKIINAAIGDARADAYAADGGLYYQALDHLSLALVASNLGSTLKFRDQPDALPAEYRAGIAYSPIDEWTFSFDTGYETGGLFLCRSGVEWSPFDLFSLRAGYRTDTISGLSGWAGFSTGMGLHLWGQELDYAWLPLGDLGNSQYVSLVIRFGDIMPAGHLQRPGENSKND